MASGFDDDRESFAKSENLARIRKAPENFLNGEQIAAVSSGRRGFLRGAFAAAAALGAGRAVAAAGGRVDGPAASTAAASPSPRASPARRW